MNILVHEVLTAVAATQAENNLAKHRSVDYSNT